MRGNNVTRFHRFNRSRKSHNRDRRSTRLPQRPVLRMERLEPRVMLDGSGPRVIDYSPQDIRHDVFDHLDLTFDEAIDFSTVSVSDIQISGPDDSIVPTGVVALADDSIRITFAPLSIRGQYTAVVGPDIADLDGNLMNQSQRRFRDRHFRRIVPLRGCRHHLHQQHGDWGRRCDV